MTTTSLDPIMVNAIRWRLTRRDVSDAIRRADIEWLLSRISDPTSTGGDGVPRHHYEYNCPSCGAAVTSLIPCEAVPPAPGKCECGKDLGHS